MNKIIQFQDDIDYIKGETLKERAILVLCLSDSKKGIDHKYRELAKRFHPDVFDGDKIKFQVINEAYHFLKSNIISKNPLMNDDNLIMEILGRKIEPILNKQKEWEKYEEWRINQFYDFIR